LSCLEDRLEGVCDSGKGEARGKELAHLVIAGKIECSPCELAIASLADFERAEIWNLVVRPDDVCLVLSHKDSILASLVVLQDLEQTGALRDPFELLAAESEKDRLLSKALFFIGVGIRDLRRRMNLLRRRFAPLTRGLAAHCGGSLQLPPLKLWSKSLALAPF
jgi:hypothetical protein